VCVQAQAREAPITSPPLCSTRIISVLLPPSCPRRTPWPPATPAACETHHTLRVSAASTGEEDTSTENTHTRFRDAPAHCIDGIIPDTSHAAGACLVLVSQAITRVHTSPSHQSARFARAAGSARRGKGERDKKESCMYGTKGEGGLERNTASNQLGGRGLPPAGQEPTAKAHFASSSSAASTTWLFPTWGFFFVFWSSRAVRFVAPLLISACWCNLQRTGCCFHA
jgi:hypothetical protein